MKLRYSTEPKFRKYVKGFSFLSFVRNIGDKYGKGVVQKTAEATGDLISNKIADKITSIGKSKSDDKTKKVEEIYILPEKRRQTIDELKLF